MEKTTVLILGSLPEFTPLVQLAASRGVRTVVVDGNRGTKAKALADVALDIDVRDIDRIAEVIGREGVSAITTAYSDLLFECAVRIAAKAGIPYHLDVSRLPFYRDKAVMKETMNRLGLPNAKGAELPAVPDAASGDFAAGQAASDRAALSSLHFPIVIKPLDLYGSRGLRVAAAIEEAVKSAGEIREAFSKNMTLLAEEYDSGREFNIQCFVRRGEVCVLGICDREKTECEAGQIPLSTRNVYPSALTPTVLPEAKRILQRYIDETKQMSGPLSMQFFYSPSTGVSVGEIAARFLGYEHELLKAACGISIEELLLAAALGDEAELDRILDAVNPYGNACAAVLYFHARDGILADESKAEQIAEHPAVTLSELFYRPGDRIGSPQRMPYFARYNIAAKDRAEVDRISAEMIRTMSAVDGQGRELVYANRLG